MDLGKLAVLAVLASCGSDDRAHDCKALNEIMFPTQRAPRRTYDYAPTKPRTALETLETTEWRDTAVRDAVHALLADSTLIALTPYTTSDADPNTPIARLRKLCRLETIIIEK